MPRVILLEPLLLGTLALGAAWQSASPRTFTGIITDSECATADHSGMRMGDTDAECVQACVEEHGATFVLYSGSTAYGLSDQKAPKAWAGRRVTITGSLDAAGRTITVTSIVAAR
jgi:hypothetical protein